MPFWLSVRSGQNQVEPDRTQLLFVLPLAQKLHEITGKGYIRNTLSISKQVGVVKQGGLHANRIW
jgi:hypothetical protein